MLRNLRIVVWIFLLLTKHFSTTSMVSFKLDKADFCPELSNSIAKVIKNEDTVIRILRNVMIVRGTTNVTQAITKPLELHIKASKCEDPANCVKENYIVVPRFCAALQKLPFTEHGFGDFFVPKWRCPIQAGLYTVNISHSLEHFSSMPIGSHMFKVRLFLYEVENETKKRLFFCLGGLVRTMVTSSRRN